MTLEETIAERDKTHGNYYSTSRMAQTLKHVIHREYVSDLEDYMFESLDQICTKLARITKGNPRTREHWKDIAGYAMLVLQRLDAEAKEDAILVASLKPSSGNPSNTDPAPIRIVEDCGCGAGADCPTQETLLVDPPDSEQFNKSWAERNTVFTEHGEDDWAV